jgi:DNA anti-recombination protein RmuC
MRLLKLGDLLIPVDAKFSLDNYNKMIESSQISLEIEGLGKEIQSQILSSRIDETSKYITTL